MTDVGPKHFLPTPLTLGRGQAWRNKKKGSNGDRLGQFGGPPLVWQTGRMGPPYGMQRHKLQPSGPTKHPHCILLCEVIAGLPFPNAPLVLPYRSS